MKEKILRELKAGESYISGQELCQKFGVSRTAVWKHIKALKEEGYVIDSVSNKGYKLVRCPDVLTAEDIKSSLSTTWLGRTVKVMKTVDSTNLEAKRLAEAGALHGTLVTAEEQTSGKGRRGRSWISVPGQGVWMSFVLRPDIELENSSMLTLVAALAVEKGIDRRTQSEKIKELKSCAARIGRCSFLWLFKMTGGVYEKSCRCRMSVSGYHAGVL